MKYAKRGLALFIAMSLLLSGSYTVSEAAVKLSRKSATMKIGQTLQLKVLNNRKKVTWSSSQNKIARVSKKGLVKAVGVGTAKIKAKVGKKTYTCKVTVKKASSTNSKAKPSPTNSKAKPSPTNSNQVQALAITGPASVLAPGGTMQLSVSYTPNTAKDKQVLWSTSDSSYATVNDSGLVTANNYKNKEVTITAKLKSNESVTASYVIAIKEIAFHITELTTVDGGDLLLSNASSQSKITFTISETVPATLRVMNGAGEIIREYDLGTVGANETKVCTWDLKNNSGSIVPEGSYYYEIEAVGAKYKSAIFNVYANSEFAGGNGSEASPYLVSNLTQLAAVQKHNGVYFKQTADLDYSYTSNIPMYSNDVPFDGCYDGNNFSIKNIVYSSESDYIGIFNTIGEKGQVRNLTLDGCSFTGEKYVGTIAGECKGVIQNCTVNACTVASKGICAGGVCGQVAASGRVLSVNTTGNVVSSQGAEWSRQYYSYAGGIAGRNYGTISSCKGIKDSVNTTNCACGGIAGDNTGNILSCTVTDPAVSAGGSKIGGVAGRNSGNISGCTVNDSQGGIYAAQKEKVGGIIGENTGSSANNTYVGQLNQIGK